MTFLDTLIDHVIQIHIIDTDPYYLNKHQTMDGPFLDLYKYYL